MSPAREQQAAQELRQEAFAYPCLPTACRQIIEEAAAHYNVTPRALQRKGNAPACVLARQEAAARLRALGFSLPGIGRILHRHHTTILYYLGGKRRRSKKKPPASSSTAQRIQLLESKLSEVTQELRWIKAAIAPAGKDVAA